MAWHPLRNLPLKLFATFLSALLWIAVTRDQIVERSLRVPLELRNLADDLEIVGESPPEVDVRVRGASGVLSRLEPGQVVAVLNLRAARPGQRLFNLLNDEVRAPLGVEVTQISPATVPLQVDRSARRAVRVVPVVEGEPESGYIAGQVTVVPETVEVVGPASRLEGLREATTEPVSLDRATATVRDTVTIGVADSALRLEQAQSAVVTVDVIAAPIERVVRDVPVRVRNLTEGLRTAVDPPRVTVVLRGPREALGALNASGLEAWIDAGSLGAGRYTLPVKAEPGAEYGVSGVDPGWVQVQLQR
jgi:YbbR domain-containing protein